MTKHQESKMNKLADADADKNYCGYGDCNRVYSFKAGYTAAHNDAEIIIERLEKALEKVISMNRTMALHKYGDEKKSNCWACVTVPKEALAELKKWRDGK
jgi:hypothetical protein